MLNVLSLFDGLGGAKIALEKCGIENQYYASEIDSYAIGVCSYNYPDVIQLGNVKSINLYALPQIDLLIGGSPCQNLSVRGDKTGITGKKSILFFDYVRILNLIKPKFFIFENVASMTKKNKQIITDNLQVEPVEINSNLFLPQTRRRLYWCNFSIEVPIQACYSHKVRDILEPEVDLKYFYTPHQQEVSFKPSSFNGNPRADLPIARPLKTSAFTSRAGADNCYHMGQNVPSNLTNLRRLTPIEFERLQGIPDQYTKKMKKFNIKKNQFEILQVSDTQRYKMIGNSFTVPVICHLFKKMQLRS